MKTCKLLTHFKFTIETIPFFFNLQNIRISEEVNVFKIFGTDVSNYLSQKKINSAEYHKLINQSGMTLIEIMIALLIGAFLVGGVMNIFVKSRQTYEVQEALSRIQENGRFALDTLGRELRKTDYREFGCENFVYTALNQPLSGSDNDGVFPNPNNVAAILDGTDTIAIRWVLSAAPCNSNSNSSFYVSLDNNLIQNATSLVDGVADMQILYGVDKEITVAVPNGDGIVDYYIPGTNANFPTANDWLKVVSVRVTLLMQSDDNVASRPVQYNYNGINGIMPTDRRIRRAFSSTYSLRNRIR